MEKMIFAADALAGQVALVTGASRGIGAAVMEAFMKAGAYVVGTATSEAGAQKITERAEALGGSGKGIVLNVCDAAASQKAVTDLVKEKGRIDILVNNAGITKDDLVLRMKDDAWEDVIETDLTAAFRLARACVRPMMKQRSGRIISMGSVVGAMGNAGQVNYAAAKAGLMGMTKDLPEDHREALLKQIALGRLGQTDDIANACLYLASPAGAYLTGVTLHVNGGMFMG